MLKRQERLLAKLRLFGADAEDVIQRANIIAWRRRSTLREPDKFDSWLCSITWGEGLRFLKHLKCSTRGREKYRTGLIHSPPEGVRELEQIEFRITADWVLSELEGIDPEFAEILHALFRGELSKSKENAIMKESRRRYRRLPPIMRQQLRELWPRRSGGSK